MSFACYYLNLERRNRNMLCFWKEKYLHKELDQEKKKKNVFEISLSGRGQSGWVNVNEDVAKSWCTSSSNSALLSRQDTVIKNKRVWLESILNKEHKKFKILLQLDSCLPFFACAGGLLAQLMMWESQLCILLK